MRFLTLSPVALLIGIALMGCDSAPPAPAANAPVGVVTIEIESSDSPTQTFAIADVADGASLESVMRLVDQIPIELSGSGSTAFVQSIGGVKMDTSQGWTFKVDGEFANQGIGQTVLHPPTTVQWSFGEFEM